MENNWGEQGEGEPDNTCGYSEGRDPTNEKFDKGHIVIPYTEGLGESINNICKRYGIQTHFKRNRIIKITLVKPKDEDPLDRKSGTIYWYQCGELACNEEYIDETSRTFGERYKEHLKEPSPIYGHSNISGHNTNPDNFTTMGREDHGLARTIKESIYIRVNKPTLKRDVGKYNLHHIWSRVLFNTPGLRITNDNGQTYRTPISGHALSLPPNRHVHRTIEHPGHAQTSEHAHRTS